MYVYNGKDIISSGHMPPDLYLIRQAPLKKENVEWNEMQFSFNDNVATLIWSDKTLHIECRKKPNAIFFNENPLPVWHKDLVWCTSNRFTMISITTPSNPHLSDALQIPNKQDMAIMCTVQKVYFRFKEVVFNITTASWQNINSISVFSIFCS